MRERFTPSGVRLRLRCERPGTSNWFLLPGGPGIGSESLHELADALAVPGRVWLVDLPGDGSNESCAADPFTAWPAVLLEALDGFDECVYVGHSTGGMYLLSVPELESRLVGLALVSSAPHAGWRTAFAAMTQRHPLPAVERASARYAAAPSRETLRDLCVASAEWNFTAPSLERGRELLSRMPYSTAAVDWSARAFDDVYQSTWWPRTLPTLVVSGDDDRIVDQSLWTADRYRAATILHRTIAEAAHFPWIEDAPAVASAFSELARVIAAQST